jgi:general secretion pathway protein G
MNRHHGITGANARKITLALRFLLLVAAVPLGACSNDMERAKEVMANRVSEKVYLEFQNLQAFPGQVVCGEYRSNDPLRGSKRYHRFIVRGESGEDRPSAPDWEIFCSQDPAAALRANFGIEALGDQNHLPRIRTDLESFQSALALYLADNSTMPSTEQGLPALVTASDVAPVPPNFKAGGYLPALPADPWGRPYVYERSRLVGVAQNYSIATLGADGLPGGTGENADVSTAQLAYLQHLANIR